MINQVEEKARYSQSEESFRRYESYIGQATKGSLEINPKLLPKAMKQSSLAVGIREAIGGYKKYNYWSKVIPQRYEMRRIRVVELTNGNVMLKNEYEDETARMTNAEEIKTLAVNVNGKIMAMNQQTPIPEEDKRLMEAMEEGEVRKWCAELMEKPAWRNCFAWLVYATEPYEIDFLKGIGREYEGLAFEQLDHGWWRLYR